MLFIVIFEDFQNGKRPLLSSSRTTTYCKFGNFHENFIFANSVKRHIIHVRNSRLWHDLPTSKKTKCFRQFPRVLFLRNSAFAKIKPSGKFPNLQYLNQVSKFRSCDDNCIRNGLNILMNSFLYLSLHLFQQEYN